VGSGIGRSNTRHGLFTWALLDALRKGDTNGDRLIELSELASQCTGVGAEARRRSRRRGPVGVRAAPAR
jgi:hypothetical protein